VNFKTNFRTLQRTFQSYKQTFERFFKKQIEIESNWFLNLWIGGNLAGAWALWWGQFNLFQHQQKSALPRDFHFQKIISGFFFDFWERKVRNLKINFLVKLTIINNFAKNPGFFTKKKPYLAAYFVFTTWST
jgi:hypothetical protein